jgi:hypothetical protein
MKTNGGSPSFGHGGGDAESYALRVDPAWLGVRARQQRECPRRWIVWADEKEVERLRQRVENSDIGKVE